MRISDWSSDVCSSDLPSWFGFPFTVRAGAPFTRDALTRHLEANRIGTRLLFGGNIVRQPYMKERNFRVSGELTNADTVVDSTAWIGVYPGRSEEHTSELQALMRRTSAISCLNKQK